MFETTKFRRAGAVFAAAALTAVGVGGVAIAQNGNQAPKVPAKEATEPSGPDRDNIRSGDQTTPDTPGQESKEVPGQESKEVPGQESKEAPGQETKANDDGPGGHADEPGNPNADHQFQGKE